MNIADKKEVLEGIKTLQKKVCAYRSETRCDCKYGIDKDKELSTGREKSGCPELRVVMILLANMTDEEYKRLTAH